MNSTSQFIFEAAHARWLNVDEIITVLSSAHDDLCRGMPTAEPILEQEVAPPSSPPTSGAVLLYDRVAVRNYKVDGHDWIRKRSNPAKIREDHVKLRYNGIHRISGTYVHSDEIDTLHRRVYRLIKTAEEKAESGKRELVLVHYLDTEQAARMPAHLRVVKRGKTLSISSSSSKRTSGTTKKRTARMIIADEHKQQYNEPMPALPTIAPSTSTFCAMNVFPKRIRTANSYAKVKESMVPHAQQQQLATLKPLPMPTLYQQLDWSSNGVEPQTQPAAPNRPATGVAVPSVESSASHLDDVNFDDIFDMFSNDAALCEGLESLIDPAFRTMQMQPPQVPMQQQPMLPPPTFKLPILHRPPRPAQGGSVTPEEEAPAYMSRVVTADDIPTVGV